MIEPKHEQAIDIISEKLDYGFSNTNLLIKALTHKSYANENSLKGEDNQRLEFLGDAVLGLIVAEALMVKLKRVSEGQLTTRRAILVQEASLAQLAEKIDLGDYIRLGRGEEMNNGRDRPSILADAVEAVIGAVYLDGGYEASREVVLRWFGSKLDAAVGGKSPDDVKTILQEKLQSEGGMVPQYRIIGEEGPDHAKIFEVEIVFGNQARATGRGRSKKEAEKMAAQQALEALEALEKS